MARSVLRYNAVIVGKFFNKGSWVSEAWRKEHHGHFEADEPPKSTEAEERMERLNPEQVPKNAACAVFWHTTFTRSWFTPAGRGTQNSENERTNKPKLLTLLFSSFVKRPVIGADQSNSSSMVLNMFCPTFLKN